MRAHRTWWARERGKARRHVGKWKDLDVLPAPMGHPGAAKCSPSHIHPPDRSEQDRLALNRHRCGWGQETTDRTHATGSIPFGRLSPDTALAKNRADNPSGRPGRRPRFGKGILLTHFAQPQAGPGWAAQLPVLLQHARPLPRNALWLVRTRRPTATGHTLAVGILPRRRQQELLWQGPTRVSRTWTPCIVCPRERRRFHTH